MLRFVPTIKVIGAVGDLLAWVTGHETEVNSAATGMSLLPKHYSSARADAELGYRSRDVAESAADAWAWLQKYGYVKAVKPFLRCSRCVRSQATCRTHVINVSNSA